MLFFDPSESFQLGHCESSRKSERVRLVLNWFPQLKLTSLKMFSDKMSIDCHFFTVDTNVTSKIKRIKVFNCRNEKNIASNKSQV